MNEMNQILEELKPIFKEILDENIEITERTTPADVEEWDSLAQLSLITAVEQHFGMKFRVTDIVAIKSVGDILRIVNEKLA